MKRYHNLYKVGIDDINEVYKEARRNIRNKNKIYRFENYYSLNISKIKDVFDSGKYDVGKYNIFLIREPKYRIIMSQNIFDKVINHIVARKFLYVLDNVLIDSNIATRKNRGTSLGVKLFRRYLNKLDGDIYALKFDISKYFYNIDHEVLIDLVKDKIKDKRVIDILVKIINSTDDEYVNECICKLKMNELLKVKRSNLNDKEKLKRIDEIERIPIYEKGKGLPIGNMTSQILAIFYLNNLDHFIKEKLKAKYYIRYMDDGVILSNDKKYLKYCLKEINRFISCYKLVLNDKTKIINVSMEGLDFLGFRFYKGYTKIRCKNKKRFKRKMALYKKGKISDKFINGYNGYFKMGKIKRKWLKKIVY